MDETPITEAKKERNWKKYFRVLLIISVIYLISSLGLIITDLRTVTKDTYYVYPTPTPIPTGTPRIALPNEKHWHYWQIYDNGEELNALPGLTINYPEGWQVNYEISTSPDLKHGVSFDFAPPDYIPQSDYSSYGWMQWGEMSFSPCEFQPDIDIWIEENLSEYKNDIIAEETDTEIDGKTVFLIKAKESVKGMFKSRWVILGSKYSYVMAFAENPPGTRERLEKEIYPTIHIE